MYRKLSGTETTLGPPSATSGVLRLMRSAAWLVMEVTSDLVAVIVDSVPVTVPLVVACLVLAAVLVRRVLVVETPVRFVLMTIRSAVCIRPGQATPGSITMRLTVDSVLIATLSMTLLAP